MCVGVIETIPHSPTRPIIASHRIARYITQTINTIVQYNDELMIDDVVVVVVDMMVHLMMDYIEWRDEPLLEMPHIHEYSLVKHITIISIHVVSSGG
jgi:hypothetical protein